MTLEAGDIIPTGTCGIVGKSILKPGDILETTVEGIGTIKNKVVAWEEVWKTYIKWEDLMKDLR